MERFESMSRALLQHQLDVRRIGCVVTHYLDGLTLMSVSRALKSKQFYNAPGVSGGQSI